MADFATALDRGWDGDSTTAAAIELLVALERDARARRGAVESVTVLRLMINGLIEFTTGSVYTVTAAGARAQQRLAAWRAVPLSEKRKAYRRLLLDAIYHERVVIALPTEGRTSLGEYAPEPDQPWAQFAGARLDPVRDLVPELDYLTERGLVAVAEVRAVPGEPVLARVPRREYRLTSKGIHAVEELGGEMPEPEQTPGRPAFSVSNTFNAPVTNVHSGMGDLNVGVDASAVLRLAEQLRAFTPSLRFEDPAQHAELVETVEVLATERTRGRIAALLEKVRGLIVKAEGPLKDIAVGVIEAELSKVTGLPPGTSS